MYKDVIAVTNRKLCDENFLHQIKKVAELKPKAIILREKDLSEDDYKILAERVMDICSESNVDVILHCFPNVAEKLSYDKIHLPLHVLKTMSESEKAHFNKIGVSVHSVEQAKEAERLGADYVTAGHIFLTDCKKGIPGRGINFLKEVISSVQIPVYAIGGMNLTNKKDAMDAGASGICMMSYFMKINYDIKI